MNELALFAGGGGGLLASSLLGWNTVCAVEIEEYCRQILFARQKDGCLPMFPIWDDIRTFDGSQWRNKIDIITGGFPCQDISPAGTRRGLTGKHSILVFEMLRVIEEVQPTFVFAENSPYLRTRGLSRLVKELDRLGYVGRVGVLGARDVGANHRRKRMWIVGISRSTYINSIRRLQQKRIDSKVWEWSTDSAKGTAHSDSQFIRQQSSHKNRRFSISPTQFREFDWWSLPRFEGVDDGLANRMERVAATGNGQVPAVAAVAWTVLTADLEFS